MDLFSDVLENPNKLSNKFISENNTDYDSYFEGSNIITIKCTKILFSKDGLKQNISSYILIIRNIQFLLSILVFLKCGYNFLVEKINKILLE